MKFGSMVANFLHFSGRKDTTNSRNVQAFRELFSQGVYSKGSERRFYAFLLLQQREGDVHHVGECGLALLGGGHLACDDMVGDGADGQCTLTGTGGIHIETSHLHLDSEDTHQEIHLSLWAFLL